MTGIEQRPERGLLGLVLLPCPRELRQERPGSPP
jgi:hypothetical protein